jgi:hypothetical protein
LTELTLEFFKRPRLARQLVTPRRAQLSKEARVGQDEVIFERVVKVVKGLLSSFELLDEFGWQWSGEGHIHMFSLSTDRCGLQALVRALASYF